MGRIGIYVEKYTISNSYEMDALMRFGQAARKMGHTVDYIFRPDMYKIPQYDAIFIRALTDPLNSTYVASRMAQMHGLPVLDDPDSIFICCDKINMYKHLLKAGVPIPMSEFIDYSKVNYENGVELLERFGSPMVLKAPNSSFSLYVDRVYTPEEFIKVGNKYSRRADRIVVQKFMKSDFDWRVGMLGGQVLYVCQYTIPKKQWKIHTYTSDGRSIYGPVIGIDIEKAPPGLLETALAAGAAIGNGLYGVDLKQNGDEFVVIEVNDNPTINSGEEDQKSGHLYDVVVSYLMNGKISA